MVGLVSPSIDLIPPFPGTGGVDDGSIDDLFESEKYAEEILTSPHSIHPSLNFSGSDSTTRPGMNSREGKGRMLDLSLAGQ